jgi:5-methylthioadenosine/S-adenosylhomocysteine deaminase
VSQVNLLIRGGYVLTIDSAGDILGGDVHIRDGVIQPIGRNLVVPEAELIDAPGKIVAPGLVDAHWHTWNTLLRGMPDGWPGAVGRDRSGYFVTCGLLDAGRAASSSAWLGGRPGSRARGAESDDRPA